MVGGADFTAVGDDCAEGRLARGFRSHSVIFRSHSGVGFGRSGGGRSGRGEGGGWWSGVSAGVPGSCVSGRGQCRVAAFSVSGLLE